MKCILVLCFVPSLLLAELQVPHFFADHMVLQRERPAAIWGWAEPEASITVEFKGKKVTTHAAADGRWLVRIETGAADAIGSVLSIQSGGETKLIQDVLVGEVWFASGQSNMFFTLNRAPEYQPLMTQANYPALRMFNAPLVTAVEPQTDIQGQWTAATPETVSAFSAVAFFFARKLHMELGIPIGVIKSAWGGKPVETFTSREALLSLPQAKDMVEAAIKADADYDQTKAEAAYQLQLRAWQKAMAEAKKKPAESRRRLPKKPAFPKRPLDTEGKPGVLFNAMIHPFVGYTMRGAIWYQGEGNAKLGAVPYDQTLPLMIRDWRQRWADEFSFYFVQLANYHAPSSQPGVPDPWPLLQDRMRRILDSTPKTGMAVINDVGEADDIHPKNKLAPGERLARWALAKDYGVNLTFSGPLLKSFAIRDTAVELTFNHVGDGLKVRDGGKLRRFEIAGADQIWHWAEASISSPDQVRVTSPEVKHPVAVRYAWAANPEGANLINSEGLPASVFRTDDWQDVEPPLPSTNPQKMQARRALAEEIRALKSRRDQFNRHDAEYLILSKKLKTLLDEFKASDVSQ